jgi:hypothetical protein
MKRICLRAICLIAILSGIGTAQNIEFVSSCLWAGAGDIEVRDSLALCAYYGGLAVFNVADPTNPSLAGQLPTEGRTGRLSLSGNCVYLANRENGLRVIDITDPANPTIIATIPTGDDCHDVFASGQYAYMVDRDSFTVVDIADPGAPARVSAIDIPKDANNIFVAGDYAFVTDDSCLHIVSIVNPGQPVIVSSTPLGDYGQGVFVNAGYAYVAAYDSGMKVFNIQDPAHPLLVGTYGAGPWAWTVFVRDNIAYYGTGFGLRAYDVTRPDSAVEIFRFDDPDHSCMGIFADSTHVFVGRSLLGFYIFNRSNLWGPIGEYLSPSHLTNIDIDGPIVVVVNPFFGFFQIADFSDPARPRRAAIQAQTTPNDVALWGDYAYLACGTSGFRVFDISNPNNPYQVGIVSPQNDLSLVAADSQYAYVVGIDPYVLLMIDVSNPSQPFMAGSRRLLGTTTDIFIDGNYAYLIEDGVVVFDVSTPSNIRRLGSYPQSARRLCADGGYIFVATGQDGIMVLDAIDPYNLTLVCTFDTAGYPTDVYKAGSRLYVADSRIDAFLAYDISDLSNPVVLGTCPDPGAAEDIVAVGNDIYASDRYSLLMLRFNPVGIWEAEPLPVENFLLRNYPNPFNAATTISVAGAGEAEIVIYDIAGRRVATLHAQNGKAVWEAKDLGSGVYFARAAGGSAATSIMLVYLK